MINRLIGNLISPLTHWTPQAPSGGNSPVFQNFAWWAELDEASGAALDSSVNVYDLTAVNSPTANATGSPLGTQCRVCAPNQYFTDTTLDFDRDWSIIGQARVQGNTVIFSIAGVNLWFEWFGGQAYFTVLGAPTASASVPVNTWFSYVITHNSTSGQIAMSVDGGTLNTVANSQTGINTLQLGNLPSYGSSDKRLFRTALTYYRMDAADVATFYNGGTPLSYNEWAAL
jgi:hypothetical protein